jgi:2-polyprenyl-3-methyl-5-hydroxy-6-metoxy-1,4-benzoquinol methylase
MHKCKICGKSLSTSKNDSLIIDNVPDNTFNFSEKTVTLHVADCKFCGCVQLINVPLSPDYDVVYRSIGVSVSYREEKKRQIEQFIKSYNLYDANMIEIGCGNGQFLEMISEICTINIVGIESGADNCSECSNKCFNVIHGNLFNVLNKKKINHLFEAFVTFHYLEHLPNPLKFVTCLYQTIKPGGVGLIEVPNYDYIERNNIWLEFTKDHRFYYRKRTLCYLLSKCGFSIEKVEENNGGICLTAVVRKPDSNDTTFSSMKNQVKKDIEDFKQLIDGLNGSFAVYGAGHYSQLLINMVHKQYGIKPIHIFDSNRQKCGHKICDVVIEHGDNVVNMQDCHNMIVICGIYNDEVCNMLSSLGNKLIRWRQ